MSALAFPRDLTFRDARHADVDAVAVLEAESFPCPWKRDYFGSEIGAPGRFNRVVRDSRGQLVAYVFCAYGGGEFHVHKIAVDPAFRGRGIARILMAEVLDRARLSRSEEVYLEVRPSNTAARQLYESLGFRQVDRRRDYYSDGEDALVLSLPISA